MIFFLIALLVLADLYWLVSDPRPLKERFSRKISLTYPRVFFTIIPQIISGLFFPWSAALLNQLFIYLGLIFFFIGLLIAVWAKSEMGSYWNLPAKYDQTRQIKLIRSGPFSFSRNPIYLGVLLFSLGFSLAVKSIFLPLVLLLFLSLKKDILREEQILEKSFGEKYLQYKKAVPRFFGPF